MINARTDNVLNWHRRTEVVVSHMRANNFTQPTGTDDYAMVRGFFKTLGELTTHPKISDSIKGRYFVTFVSARPFPQEMTKFKDGDNKVSTEEIRPFLLQGSYIVYRVEEVSVSIEGLQPEEFMTATISVANGQDFQAEDWAQLAHDKHLKVDEMHTIKFKKEKIGQLFMIMSSNINTFCRNKTANITAPMGQQHIVDQHGAATAMAGLAQAVSSMSDSEGKKSERKAASEQTLLRDPTVFTATADPRQLALIVIEKATAFYPMATLSEQQAVALALHKIALDDSATVGTIKAITLRELVQAVYPPNAAERPDTEHDLFNMARQFLQRIYCQAIGKALFDLFDKTNTLADKNALGDAERDTLVVTMFNRFTQAIHAVTSVTTPEMVVGQFEYNAEWGQQLVQTLINMRSSPVKSPANSGVRTDGKKRKDKSKGRTGTATHASFKGVCGFVLRDGTHDACPFASSCVLKHVGVDITKIDKKLLKEHVDGIAARLDGITAKVASGEIVVGNGKAKRHKH